MYIYLCIDKKESSSSYRSISDNKTKRKNPDSTTYSGIEILQFLL